MSATFPRKWVFATTILMVLGVIQLNLPNLGNNLIPRNFFAWAVLVLAAAGLWIHTVRQPRFFWSNGCYFWAIPSIAVLAHSIMVPATLAYYAVLAAGALLAFALWLVALLQARLTEQDWAKLSYWVLGGALLLVVLAMPSANYLNRPEWLSSLPLVLRLPEGGFQQRNVFASFLGSVLLWSWAMHLRGGANRIGGHVLLAIAAFLIAWCIYLSGSRTGSVGVTLCVCLLAVAALWRGWRGLGLWLPGVGVIAALVLTIYLPIEDINARMADLADGSSTRTRASMWQVAWQTGLQSPWMGHGLGSFTEAFHPVFVQMAQSGVALDYVNFLNHPHNETLLWWVETGLYGWLLVIGPWVVSLLYLGLWRNPSALLFCAALGPMLLHTQTEFPLHTSGVHWWLAGLIIASTVRGDLLPQRAMALRPIWPAVITGFATLAVAGLLQTGWLSYQNWTRQMREALPLGEQVQRRSQDPEINHFVLGREASDFWLLSLGRIAVSQQDPQWVSQLLPTLEGVQSRWQGPPVWRVLAGAYLVTGDQAALNRQLEWVSALQPSEGAKLRAQFEP